MFTSITHFAEKKKQFAFTTLNRIDFAKRVLIEPYPFLAGAAHVFSGPLTSTRMAPMRNLCSHGFPVSSAALLLMAIKSNH